MSTHFSLPIAVALMWLAGCSAPHPEASSDDTGSPIAVRVARAAREPIPDVFDAGGIVQAKRRAAIASRIMAPIADIRVTAGERVRRGDPLVMLDARQLQASAGQAAAALSAAERAVGAAAAEKEAAEAAVALASASFERMAALATRKSATAQELDQARAALRSAEARTRGTAARADEAAAAVEAARSASEVARVNLTYAQLTAPFDGVIAERLADPGNLATPGAPLLILEDVSAFQLETRIDASRAAGVNIDHEVEVVIGGGAGTTGSAVTGRVTEITRAADPTAHTLFVEIALPDDPRVHSGLYGTARFARGSSDHLVVPASAVVRRGQVTSVFVARDGRARLRLVRLGAEVGALVTVLAGLDAGEEIVLDPPGHLVDGAAIEAARGEASSTTGDAAGAGPR